jgi:uncharacterized membrane protein YkvA (DUF1232 family)
MSEDLGKKDLDFYQSLRARIKKWLETGDGKSNKFAEYILLAPDLFHLLIRLMLDEGVPLSEKAKLGIVVAYFISPLDLLPEAILGPLGYLDDIALTAYVLNQLVNKTDDTLIKKHWAGEGDVLEVIQKIIHDADEMVGSGLWSKIKKRLDGK